MKYTGNGMYGFITWCRLDALAAGALIVLRPRWTKHGWVALPVAVWLLWSGEWVLVYSALAIGFASVITYVVSTPNRFLAWTPVSFVGKISYGIYIMNPLVFAIFWKTPLNWGTEHWPHDNLIRMVGQILLPIPVAALSWHLFEKPILGLKKYFDSDSPRAGFPQPAPELRPAIAAEAGD
jgi:peptidoglycan/LPS O-acetylase OafA/YrhL